MADHFKVVTEHYLRVYRCGLRSGDRVKLKTDIVIRDHRNRPTGKMYPRGGEVWTIVHGMIEEPDIIWLLQVDGETHTWDTESFFDTFEKVEDDQRACTQP